MSRPHGGLGSNLAARLAWQVSLLAPDPSTVPHPHLECSRGRSILSLAHLHPWAREWYPAAGDGIRGKKKQRRESI